jgi:hypothetical protein
VNRHLIDVQLLDGRTVGIRPISPSDREALVQFHEGLTSETTRLRFFILHPHLMPREVERFTHVDHHDREALVALDGPDIIAVGRFEPPARALTTQRSRSSSPMVGRAMELART